MHRGGHVCKAGHYFDIIQSWGRSPTYAGFDRRVYLVREPRSRREYAAKIVQKQGDSVTREIQREITIHSSLSHANIIRLVSTHEDKDYIYMLMEFASGGELFDRISRQCSTSVCCSNVTGTCRTSSRRRRRRGCGTFLLCPAN